MPRAKNPVTETRLPKVTQDAPTAYEPTEIVTTPTESKGLNLPQGFEVSIPDIDQFATGAIGFSPSPELPRVTDGQRQQDAIIYREQMNAAENLKDSIKVAKTYVSAAIEGTKLGKALTEYQTGLQDMKTSEVGLSKAVIRTEIAHGQLAELQLQRNFHNDSFAHLEAGYQSQLLEVKSRAQRASLKAQDFLAETKALYPTIEV